MTSNTCSTDDTGDVYLPFLSLGTLYGSDQMFLDRDDDGSSDAISAGGNDGFPFGGSVQTQFYVCEAIVRCVSQILFIS